jgi:hypothetical protein
MHFINWKNRATKVFSQIIMFHKDLKRALFRQIILSFLTFHHIHSILLILKVWMKELCVGCGRNTMIIIFVV